MKVMGDASMGAYGLYLVGEGDEIISRELPVRWWRKY